MSTSTAHALVGQLVGASSGDAARATLEQLGAALRDADHGRARTILDRAREHRRLPPAVLARLDVLLHYAQQEEQHLAFVGLDAAGCAIRAPASEAAVVEMEAAIAEAMQRAGPDPELQALLADAGASLEAARAVVWTGRLADLLGASLLAVTALVLLNARLWPASTALPLALVYGAAVAGSLYAQRGPRWSLTERLAAGELRSVPQLLACAVSVLASGDAGQRAFNTLSDFGWRLFFGGLGLPLLVGWALFTGAARAPRRLSPDADA